jgi:hypothetical protein
MPKAVGRYQIVDRLAVGGMAELFKATLTGDHGFEAGGDQEDLASPGDRQVIRRDVHRRGPDHRAARSSPYRSGVRAGTDADTPYIAMQYVDGPTLALPASVRARRSAAADSRR